MPRTRYYAPGAVLPSEQGLVPRERSETVGPHQLDILLRCRRSPSRGTLLRREPLDLLLSEIQSAGHLHERGLIELRQYGSRCLGYLWVVVLTEPGWDLWLGLRTNERSSW